MTPAERLIHTLAELDRMAADAAGNPAALVIILDAKAQAKGFPNYGELIR